MKINFINDKEMQNKITREFDLAEKIFDKCFHIIDEFKHDKKIFFLNLLKGRLPRHNYLGLFGPPESINVNLEGINRYHGITEKSLIRKTIEVICHETIHREIFHIDKSLTVKQEHWAIKRMGY